MRRSISSLENEVMLEKGKKKLKEFDKTLERKCQLLGFLYLNEGLILVNNNKQDSVKVFKSAFRFCLENIGELHMITSKIKGKLNNLDRHEIIFKIKNISVNKKNFKQIENGINIFNISRFYE